MFRTRDSISRKLTLLTLLASVTAVVCASVAFFAFDLGISKRDMVQRLNVEAQIIGSNCVTPIVFNDPKAAESTLSALRAARHVLFAGVYTPAGKFFAGYWRDRNHNKHPPPLISNSQIRNRLLLDSPFELVQDIVFEHKLLGTIYIQFDTQELRARFASYLAIVGLILIASLIAALMVSRMSRRVISEPIVRLAGTARSVSRDRNYAVRAEPPENQDEIFVLVDSFNAMLAEIQKRDTALQEREEQFRTLANSVPQLAWMAEADGRIFWYNERWYHYTGSTQEEMVGWGWETVHDPNVLPEVLARWRASIETGNRFEMVFPLRGREGTYRDFLTISVPVHDSYGKIVRWFGTNTDVTEQRRAEEALRRSEKLAATGRLAASIAHEINNPLEALGNLLYLAKKKPLEGEKYLSIAEQELDRIAEITKHTLGFYRDAAAPVRVNIADLASGVLALYDRKLQFKEVHVRKIFSKETEVLGYPGEIRQILANLVTNAIEAVGPGGRLSLKVTPSREWGGSRRRGVRVTVADNGSGIGREQMRDIFEPFYTTKKDVGIGLGLWLTHNLVQKHHGTIRVRSVVDSGRSGTAFAIFFPWETVRDAPSAEISQGVTEVKPNVTKPA
ncbi:MAG TPA: ATP-binding protein [Terriglobia bacterium]|nr:ATP-binding protein [Terriglobia bacterium]